MTTLVFEAVDALSALAQSLRLLPARLARTIDALVSARAARAVPEWQMRQVGSEIIRYRNLVGAGERLLPKASRRGARKGHQTGYAN
jgi:hypothetical protein